MISVLITNKSDSKDKLVAKCKDDCFLEQWKNNKAFQMELKTIREHT